MMPQALSLMQAARGGPDASACAAEGSVSRLPASASVLPGACAALAMTAAAIASRATPADRRIRIAGLVGTGSKAPKMFQSDSDDDGPPHDAPELVGTGSKGPKMFDSDDDGPPHDATGLVGPGRGTHDMPIDSATVDDGTLRLLAANEYEWADPKYAKAAAHVLNTPMLESIQSVCSNYDIKPKWLVKLAVVAAGLTTECHKARWQSLLLSLKELKAAERVECLRFTWVAMSDETPTMNRVQSSASPCEELNGEGGIDEEAIDTVEAKVMAVRLRFCMLVADTGGSAPGPAAASGGDPGIAAARRFYVLHGSLPSRLQAMQAQTGPIVTQALLQEASIWEYALVRDIFRDVHRFDCTDLHPSMLQAVRALACKHPDSQSAHVRCGVHRLRTSELNALKIDSEVDSFFMEVTLLLRASGVLSDLRVRARNFVAENWIVRKGSPPADVTAWREACVKLLRSRVSVGHGTEAEVLMLHSWDVCFNGDGRLTNVVEHYHNELCACDDEACRKRCIGEGVDSLLKQAPRPYSRRSWHGHVMAVDDILLLSSVHSLLGLVSGLKKRRRRPQQQQPREQPGVSDGLFPYEAVVLQGLPHSQCEGDIARQRHEDETRQRMLAVTTFLETQDCHSRMLRYRDVMAIYGDARGPVLARAGPQWEVSQMNLGELRKYHASEAYFASDAKTAVTRLCSGRGLPAVTTWGTLPSGPTFGMLVRGAASLIGLVIEEQAQYPYKLFACLVDPDVVDEVLLDAAARLHMMDPVSKDHVQRYATKESMLSVEAMACLESAALIIPETTQHVEQGHAAVKRGQRAREQTHKENLSIASAMRVLRYSRVDVDLLVPRRWLRDGSGIEGTEGSDHPGVAARRPKARPITAKAKARPKAEARPDAKRKARKAETKPRRRSAYQAYLASERPGTFEGAGGNYRAAVQDEEQLRRFKERADEMTALARAGIRRQPRVDCWLRRLRERMLRNGQKWTPSIGRALMRQRRQDPYWTSQEDRRQQWMAARKRGREDRAHEDEAARQKARRLKPPLVLEPLSQGTVLHEGVHAKVGLWWCPDVRPDVSLMLPGTMATQQRGRLADWAHKHLCIKPSDAPAMPQESAESRRARTCQRCGSCLCRRPLRKSFVTKWRSALTGLLRKPHRALATLRGPNEARVAFDSGNLLVRTESLENSEDVSWHHISFARLSPFRSVLLEMTPCIDGEFPPGIVGLTPTRSSPTPGSSDRPWRFVREHVVLSCLDMGIRRRVSLCKVERVRWEFDVACVIHARPILGSQRSFWNGSDEQVPRESIIDEESGKSDEGNTTGGEDSDDAAPKGGRRALSCPKAGSPAPKIEAKPPQSCAKAGSPAPKVEPKPKAEPKAKPKAMPGSTQEWARPLVPGHPASGGACIPNLLESSLNRITRSSNATQWVARFSVSSEMNMTQAKVDSSLRNKTRSVVYHDLCEEHDAFRLTLLWLWRRYAMSMTRDNRPLPEPVRRCLGPMRDGELQPCPECILRTCTFMDRAPVLVPKMAAGSSRSATATRVPAGSESAAGSQSGPAFSGGVPEPAAPPSRSGSAVAPDPVRVVAKSTPASSSSAPRPAAISRPPLVGVCIVCRASGATWMHGLYLCATCSLEDSEAAKCIVHRCPQTSQLVLECPGPLREGGRGWKLLQVEPDGNCLFATLTLGRMQVLDSASRVPSDPVELKRFTATAAAACRAQYIQFVREKQHTFMIGGLAMQQLIQSSTSMNTEEYLTHMEKPSGRSSWGGYLEVAVIVQKWRCRAVTFQFEPELRRAVAITYAGEDIASCHNNRGRIAILWSGTHYDLILLSDELQRALP